MLKIKVQNPPKCIPAGTKLYTLNNSGAVAETFEDTTSYSQELALSGSETIVEKTQIVRNAAIETEKYSATTIVVNRQFYIPLEYTSGSLEIEYNGNIIPSSRYSITSRVVTFTSDTYNWETTHKYISYSFLISTTPQTVDKSLLCIVDSSVLIDKPDVKTIIKNVKVNNEDINYIKHSNNYVYAKQFKLSLRGSTSYNYVQVYRVSSPYAKARSGILNLDWIYSGLGMYKFDNIYYGDTIYFIPVANYGYGRPESQYYDASHCLTVTGDINIDNYITNCSIEQPGFTIYGLNINRPGSSVELSPSYNKDDSDLNSRTAFDADGKLISYTLSSIRTDMVKVERISSPTAHAFVGEIATQLRSSDYAIIPAINYPIYKNDILKVTIDATYCYDIGITQYQNTLGGRSPILTYMYQSDDSNVSSTARLIKSITYNNVNVTRALTLNFRIKQRQWQKYNLYDSRLYHLEQSGDRLIPDTSRDYVLLGGWSGWSYQDAPTDYAPDTTRPWGHAWNENTKIGDARLYRLAGSKYELKYYKVEENVWVEIGGGTSGAAIEWEWDYVDVTKQVQRTAGSTNWGTMEWVNNSGKPLRVLKSVGSYSNIELHNYVGGVALYTLPGMYKDANGNIADDLYTYNVITTTNEDNS